MNITAIKSEDDMYMKLKWLMLARVLFTTLLLGSTIILQTGETSSPLDWALLSLYGLIVLIFLLSFIYGLILPRINKKFTFAYIQIIIDTLIVTLIIFVTGSYSSIFSFLYLVVLIYSSMLLHIRGSMIMAALCSIQYGILIDLEYYGFLKIFLHNFNYTIVDYPGSRFFYKVIITMIGCFAVAYLSGLLAEQTKKTRIELRAMEDHVKRVEKMAAIGEMGAGLAHEIKNPLASLAGSIQLLKDSLQLDSDHERLMKIVLREADRLSSLVNNFLLFARPPMGKVKPIELNKAINETLELFEKDSVGLGDITITKEMLPGLWVNMDPIHLQQVIWNLFLNAAEAIDGKGNIQVRLYQTKNKHSCIEIKDSGCGMSREILQSIFDPFFTTKQSGTGLGLSIVHSILESYDNRLDVESEVDIGTTFKLKIKSIDPPEPPT